MGQIEFPSEPNWQPLRLVLPDEKLRGEFMFMGTFVGAEEGSARIELYKHLSNRLYLNADAEGNCYIYDGANAAGGENPYRKISRREVLGDFAVSVGKNRSSVIS